MLKFVAFKGVSKLSNIIKFFTRSEYSHIAVLLQDNTLIEAWGKIPDVKWMYSSFKAHTVGTPFDVYGIELARKEEELAIRFYKFLAETNVRYNWLGVVGFVLPFFTSSGGYFCSEGCWEGLRFASREFWHTEGWKVSPDLFVRLILAHGGELLWSSIVS